MTQGNQAKQKRREARQGLKRNPDPKKATDTPRLAPYTNKDWGKAFVKVLGQQKAGL